MITTQICIPCMDTMPSLFVAALGYLDKPDSSVVFEIGSMIYTSRNNLAVKAIESGAEWTFWLDSDMIFAPDIMTRMLETARGHNFDILTAVCYRRKPPYKPCILDRLEILQTGDADLSEFAKIPDDIFEVGGAGFGCMLVKTDVFKNVFSRFGECFTPIKFNSEDMSFCWRARQCGYRIYADPQLNIGHIGSMICNRNTYEAYKKQHQ